jgi:hypothetical protein
MLKRRSGRSTAGGGPPRLDLQLWRRARLLLLLNCIPLLGGLVVLLYWWQGKITFKPMSTSSMTTVAILIGACIIFAVAVWIVLPMARWLREYPLWHFRSGSRVLWLVPVIAGTVVWLALALVGVLASLGALVLIGVGAVRLLRGG